MDGPDLEKLTRELGKLLARDLAKRGVPRSVNFILVTISAETDADDGLDGVMSYCASLHPNILGAAMREAIRMIEEQKPEGIVAADWH